MSNQKIVLLLHPVVSFCISFSRTFLPNSKYSCCSSPISRFPVQFPLQFTLEMFHYFTYSPISDQAQFGTHQLVSEPLDPLIEGSREGSSNHGESGGRTTERGRASSIEDRFLSIEGTMEAMAGTVIDLNGKLDHLSCKINRMMVELPRSGRDIDELSRSRHDHEFSNPKLRQTAPLHHSPLHYSTAAPTIPSHAYKSVPMESMTSGHKFMLMGLRMEPEERIRILTSAFQKYKERRDSKAFEEPLQKPNGELLYVPSTFPSPLATGHQQVQQQMPQAGMQSSALQHVFPHAQAQCHLHPGQMQQQEVPLEEVIYEVPGGIEEVVVVPAPIQVTDVQMEEEQTDSFVELTGGGEFPECHLIENGNEGDIPEMALEVHIATFVDFETRINEVKDVNDLKSFTSQKFGPAVEEKHFESIGSRHLSGSLVSALTRKSIRPHIDDVNVAAVACGFGKAIGNKRADDLRMRVYHRLNCLPTPGLNTISCGASSTVQVNEQGVNNLLQSLLVAASFGAMPIIIPTSVFWKYFAYMAWDPGILVGISIISSIAFAVLVKFEMPDWWYLQPSSHSRMYDLKSCIIWPRPPCYNSHVNGYLIPISLYITIEVARPDTKEGTNILGEFPQAVIDEQQDIAKNENHGQQRKRLEGYCQMDVSVVQCDVSQIQKTELNSDGTVKYLLLNSGEIGRGDVYVSYTYVENFKPLVPQEWREVSYFAKLEVVFAPAHKWISRIDSKIINATMKELEKLFPDEKSAHQSKARVMRLKGSTSLDSIQVIKRFGGSMKDSLEGASFSCFGVGSRDPNYSSIDLGTRSI